MGLYNPAPARYNQWREGPRLRHNCPTSPPYARAISSEVERFVDTEEVIGSIPILPISAAAPAKLSSRYPPLPTRSNALRFLVCNILLTAGWPYAYSR